MFATLLVERDAPDLHNRRARNEKRPRRIERKWMRSSCGCDPTLLSRNCPNDPTVLAMISPSGDLRIYVDKVRLSEKFSTFTI